MSTTSSELPPSSSKDCDDLEVIVRDDGTVLFVHDDDLYEMMAVAFDHLDVSRASHVERDGDRWVADMRPLAKKFYVMPLRIVTARRDEALAREIEFVRGALADFDMQPKEAVCSRNLAPGNASTAAAPS